MEERGGREERKEGGREAESESRGREEGVRDGGVQQNIRGVMTAIPQLPRTV